MTIELSLSDADVARIAAAVVAELKASAPQPAEPSAFISEPRAAFDLGVHPHVLRDARKRGEIEFARAGRSIRYTKAQLDAWLTRHAAPKRRKK